MYIVVGLGNCGSQIVKAAALSEKLAADSKFYAIDSVTSSFDMKSLSNVTPLPIISDENTGSGRSRERGSEMMQMHLSTPEFTTLIRDCGESKSPVIIISSTAGGTGSGAIVPLCKKIIDENPDITLIPILVVPAMDDPIAYHMNTADLMAEMGEIGIKTYCVFRNKSKTSNYTEINQEVVTAIEILHGKWYGATDVDSVDDTDMIRVCSVPGRLIIVKTEATNTQYLKRLITEKVLNGNQPWSDPSNNFSMLAISLKSGFANGDIDDVFDDIKSRCLGCLDTFKNPIQTDDSTMVATCIISGLPNVKLREIDLNDYQVASGISDGVKKSTRPDFMKKNTSVKKSALGSIRGHKISNE